MTVGLLGGTFDPPHNGHVALARSALERFSLERLVVVVARDPPHKRAVLDPESRLELAEAAFRGLPRTEISRVELDREGPSYTIDTARWAADRWGDVVFLVGADEFADFLSWRDPDGVLEAVRLGVATRPGFPEQSLRAVLERLRAPERVEFFSIPPLAVSSSELRGRVGRGESVDGLVPPAVARRIGEAGLYRLRGMPSLD